MKQWIIKRYNKGQDKWRASDWQNGVMLYKCNISYHSTWVVLYDFLFNPKWGFAKAFVRPPFVENLLMSMVISPDPLEYLEQFNPNSVEGE